MSQNSYVRKHRNINFKDSNNQIDYEQKEREITKFKQIAMQLLDENDQLRLLNDTITTEVEKYATVEINDVKNEIEEITKKQEELEKIAKEAEKKMVEVSEKKPTVHERLYNLRKKKGN